MAAISGDKTISEELLASFEPATVTSGSALDRVAGFKPAILAIRGGTTVMSIVLAAPAFVERDWRIVAWTGLIAVYNIVRLAFPIRYVTADTSSLLRVLFEVVLHVLAVVATGYWNSPLVFALITAVMVAGFARGFGFALRIGLASAMAVSIPYLVASDPVEEVWRETVQWTAELVLVALIAGYARRVTGEADRQHTWRSTGWDVSPTPTCSSTRSTAWPRRSPRPSTSTTRSTPPSAGCETSSTFDGAVVFLLDETDQMWVVARWDGPAPRSHLHHRVAAGAPAVEAVETVRHPVLVHRPAAVDRPASPPRWLRACTPRYRHATPCSACSPSSTATSTTSRLRDQELVDGFVEPAALAIDNARWFARLRTVGADEERTSIARDLHDRIGQSLAYLAFELDRIVDRRKGDAGHPHLEQLRNDVRGVIGEVATRSTTCAPT
jgi:signal transduction histidine kinase